MKVSELRPCDNCTGRIAPAFWVIRFSQALIRARAVNEFMGMHQFFGGLASAALVENFAPAAAEAALVFMDKDKDLQTELFICTNCFLGGPLDLARLMEVRVSAALAEHTSKRLEDSK